LLEGNSRPEFWMAQRTRSRASFTSTSASPTKVKVKQYMHRNTYQNLRWAIYAEWQILLPRPMELGSERVAVNHTNDPAS